MTSLSKIALVASASLMLMSGTAMAQDKTFNIWWFEDADSAQGIAWTKALEEFKADAPRRDRQLRAEDLRTSCRRRAA